MTTLPFVLDPLRDADLAGRVSQPGDRNWDDARRAWNLAVDQRPAAVVTVADAAGVAAAIRLARCAGLAVMAQPRGHGAVAAALGDVLLLRTSSLDEVTVDPVARTARVGAGVTWGTLLSQLDGTGLLALAGSNPDVSVVGYLLGGGLSWFGRRYGMGSDAVRAVELVNPQGIEARVTAESDPELFWALRGGGGDFGIVTAMEIALFPAPPIIGGKLLFPIGHARPVLTAVAELSQVAPHELTVWAGVMHFPPLPHLPEPIRGNSFTVVDLTFLGSEPASEALLWTLRGAGLVLHDTVGTVPVGRLGEVAAEPVDPTPGMDHAMLLSGFDETLVERLLAAVGDRADTPLMSVMVRHLGGALAERRPTSGVAGHIGEPYLVHALGAPVGPGAAPRLRDGFAAVQRGLGDAVVDAAPFNFLGGRPVRDAYGPAPLARLRDLKRARDPEGVIRSNRPVLEQTP